MLIAIFTDSGELNFNSTVLFKHKKRTCFDSSKQVLFFMPIFLHNKKALALPARTLPFFL